MDVTSHKSTDGSDESSKGKRVQRTEENVSSYRGGSPKLFFSVIVGTLLIMTSLLISPHHAPSVGSTLSSGKPVGPLALTPAHAHTEANGLETTLSITPGPYFLSELVSVDITLTNSSRQAIQLQGGPDINTCTGAFSVTTTGGQEPHYMLPVKPITMSCPAGMSTLAAKQSLSAHGYIPITRSGAATVMMDARVSTLASNDGLMSNQGSNSLTVHWPTITIEVAPQIPSDRLFSLQKQGNTVIVNTLESLRPHLVYYYTVSCVHGSGTNGGWELLKAKVLQEPYCDDPTRHWDYAVSASGYAVAAISMNS